MYIRKKYLSRRTVLQGAGASVALPFLDAMVPAGTALANTAAQPSPRMAFVYFSHGAIMDRWEPKEQGTDFTLPQILEPLADFKDRMTVVSGLRNKPAESTSPHAIIAGTWLNCVHPEKTQSAHAGTTVDQIAAQRIGQDTPFPSLQISTETGGPCDPNYGCSYGYTLSFRTPTQPLPMEYNPRKLFQQLFGQGDTPEERKAITEEKVSILDLVKDQAATMKRSLSAPDRAMLDDYLGSVREIERRIQKMEERDIASLDLPDAPVGVPSDFDAHLNIMFDMMALAFQANLTRVISFMMSKEISMRTYNNVGVSEAFHPLSHHQNDPEKMDKLARIQTYHSQVFAKFIKRLAEAPDGEGSVLDNSMILYGSNMSNSDLHDSDPLPSAILGRAGGRIKGGQHLKYPQDTPHANLLLTMLNRAGIPQESFGDATGPFAEI